MARRLVLPLTTHPDAFAVLAIVVLGAALRVAFFPRAPVFFHGDSIQYYVPAHALMLGEGFPLSLKRPPVYPVLLALLGRGFGEDLRIVVAVQHVLGIATAALAYGVGRLTFGHGVGLLAGLATALSGGLLLYEHYLLTEALFTFLLTLATFVFLVAMRRDRGWLFAATGLVIGLASLTRPHAQLLLLLVPPVAALCYRRWRPILRATLLVSVAAACVMVPWMARNLRTHGAFTVAGALGQNLVANTAVFHNGHFVFFDWDNPIDDPDPKRLEARKIIQRRADDKTEDPSLEVWGISIHQRLRRQLNLSEAQADRYMRDAALDAIRARPLTYARFVFDDFRMIWMGVPEELSTHWYWDDRYWPRPLRHVVVPPTPEQEAGLPTTTLLTDLFQGPRLGPILPALFLVGLVASVAIPVWRPALLPALIVLSFHLASAATVGFVPRYHHPPDPLLHVVAIGGGLILVRLAASLVARLRQPREDRLVGAEQAAPAPR